MRLRALGLGHGFHHQECAHVSEEIGHQIEEHHGDAVGRDGGEPDQHVADVGHARVGQQPLDVLLRDRHQVAADDGDGGEAGGHGHPEEHAIAHALEIEPEDHHEAGRLGRHREPRHEGRAGGLVGVGHPHVERERGDLEAQPAQRQQHPEQHHRVPRRHGGRDPAHVGGAGDPVDERQAVGQHGRGDRAHQEELQRRLHRLRLALQEAGQVVERDGHQLEGHEEQDQVAGRGQDQHAEQRGQDGQVVLGGPPGEGDGLQRAARRARRSGWPGGRGAWRRGPARPAPGRPGTSRCPPRPARRGRTGSRGRSR